MATRVRAKHDIAYTYHYALGAIRAGMIGTIASEIGSDVLSVAFPALDPLHAYPILVYRRDFDVLEEDQP